MFLLYVYMMYVYAWLITTYGLLAIFLGQAIAMSAERCSVEVDSAEEATVVTTTMETATAGLRLPCTENTGTPGTTLPTGTPATTPHPTGMPETTMTAGVAGATPPTGLPLLTVAGQEGSGLGRCRIPRTVCPKGVMAAVLVAVATTGEGLFSLRQQRPDVKLDNKLRMMGLMLDYV